MCCDRAGESRARSSSVSVKNAERRGFSVAGGYVDAASGRNADRPPYQRLVRYDAWRHDRFARSTQALMNALKEFQALGVGFTSCQEQIDTTTPQGEMVFGFLASLAQFESSLISERVKAGMQRAKEEGTHVGRPPISDEKQIRVLKAESVSINQIAKRLDIAYGTAWNYVQEMSIE
jgi:DNA invertase Pin-like site-specific DNA recombinase